MFINSWRLFLIRVLFPSAFHDFFAVFFSHYYYYLVSGTRLTIALNAHCSRLLLVGVAVAGRAVVDFSAL